MEGTDQHLEDASDPPAPTTYGPTQMDRDDLPPSDSLPQSLTATV